MEKRKKTFGVSNGPWRKWFRICLSRKRLTLRFRAFSSFLLTISWGVLTFTDVLQWSDEVIITDDREGSERVQHYQDVNLWKQQYYSSQSSALCQHYWVFCNKHFCRTWHILQIYNWASVNFNVTLTIGKYKWCKNANPKEEFVSFCHKLFKLFRFDANFCI